MLAIRINFKKEGRARFISHLDLNRCMQRALRRAEIPIWRTQGFNPHQYIVFALPLSIFYESDCEIMDARLDDEMPLDEVKTRLNAVLPEGIVVTGVALPEKKIAEIGFAEYSLALEFSGKTKKEIETMLDSLFSRENIIIEKATKRKTIEIDIKDYFDNAETEASDGVLKIKTVLPSGSQGNLNPAVICDALKKYAAAPDFERIRRTQILDKDMQPFL